MLVTVPAITQDQILSGRFVRTFAGEREQLPYHWSTLRFLDRVGVCSVYPETF
jgi:hypothetical protein